MPFCKKCGAELSEDSKFCPACGLPTNSSVEVNVIENQVTEQKPKDAPIIKKKSKTKKIGCLIIVAIIILISMVSLLCGKCEEAKKNKLVEVKEVTGAKCSGCSEIFFPETTLVKRQFRYARNLEYTYRYRDTICAICEDKFKKEANSLFAEGSKLFSSKKFDEARSKFVEAKQKGHKQAGDWIKKADQEINKANKLQEEKAKSVLRASYQNTLRGHFLDQNLDIKVRVHGPNNKYLTLTFVLFNDVWVHNFQKGELIKEVKALGFEKIYFKDGYDYSMYIYWD